MPYEILLARRVFFLFMLAAPIAFVIAWKVA
jgi:hypothetical protein